MNLLTTCGQRVGLPKSPSVSEQHVSASCNDGSLLPHCLCIEMYAHSVISIGGGWRSTRTACLQITNVLIIIHVIATYVTIILKIPYFGSGCEPTDVYTYVIGRLVIADITNEYDFYPSLRLGRFNYHFMF